MTPESPPPVTILGLGAMGSTLARALLTAGHEVTVWNRTPGKAIGLVRAGAVEAADVRDAVTAAPVVVACLLDHASVHQQLDSVAEHLRGRHLINLTTTTPEQARELATWATGAGIAYLDGGIMATPDLIATPDAAILYSGSQPVFEAHRDVLDAWATSSYLGTDAGLASLQDLAMLSGMYLMFGGFLHGAAMVASAGVSATEYAARATPFLAAMTSAFTGLAADVDAGRYDQPGGQSLQFSDLGDLIRASSDAGVRPDLIAPLQAMIRRLVDAGHGNDDFTRVYEEIRRTA